MTDAPTETTTGVVVRVQRGGPYRVEGLSSVARRQRVMSEHGEPMTWRTGEVRTTGNRVSLCRCGHSERKPFCDGNHGKVGFGGAETASVEPRAERAKDYEGTGIVVHDDRSLCVHAGFCGNRATDVWKLAKADATEDSIVRMQVIAMIERCPSGALSYSLGDDPDPIEPALAQAVGVIDDGPLFVSGGVRIERSDSVVMETRNRVTLCRCGESQNKPLCDGSHVEAKFRDS